MPTPTTYVWLQGLLQGPQGPQGANAIITPYRGEFYVNPASTVTPQVGTQSAPYTSIAAAFSAFVAGGYTRGIVYVPFGYAFTESWNFPTVAGAWEVRGIGDGVGNRTTITGSCVCTSTGQSSFTLTNIALSGSVTGNAASVAGNFLQLRDSQVGSVALTRTTGAWYINLNGNGTNFFAFGGACLGNFTLPVDGCQLFANNWYFGGNVSTSSGPSELTNAKMLVGKTLTIGGLGVLIRGLQVNGKITITGEGSTTLSLDGLSAATLERYGSIVTGCVVNTLVANHAAHRALTNNQLPLPFNGDAAAHSLPGLYRCTGVGTQKISGTGTETMTFSVGYTDLGGVARTLTVCSGLAVNAAGGASMHGSTEFYHNGSTSITYSATGIVTPGLLSYGLDMSINMVS